MDLNYEKPPSRYFIALALVVFLAAGFALGR